MIKMLFLAILSAFLYSSKGKATYYGEHWTGRLSRTISR